MHRLYLEKHPESPVSYYFYNRYFKENFHLSFGNPRSDTCQKCDNMEMEMRSPSISADRRKELDIDKKKHI